MSNLVQHIMMYHISVFVKDTLEYQQRFSVNDNKKFSPLQNSIVWFQTVLRTKHIECFYSVFWSSTAFTFIIRKRAARTLGKIALFVFH